jgi:hypothetical protein
MPDVRADPVELIGKLDRPSPEDSLAIHELVAGLGEMGVEMDTVRSREGGSFPHQVRRDLKR